MLHVAVKHSLIVTSHTVHIGRHLMICTVGRHYLVNAPATNKCFWPTKLGVVASVSAVVCKWMLLLPTMLGPPVHSGKDTTQKTL